MFRPAIAILAGALLTVALALVGAGMSAQELSERLSAEAKAAIDGRPVTARFTSEGGSPSRHAMLTPRGDVPEKIRAQVAGAVAAIPGVGGVHWTDGTMLADAGEVPLEALQCQDDVAAILGARTIRFEESSAELAAGGTDLLDEVAAALRPCFGARIAITGHTDGSGDEPANKVLSLERADMVKRALVARGIPEASLQTKGLGSSVPVAGLDPSDPANRRIEFKVVARLQVKPSPIDTPGPR
ncbi:OmpA family protein [Erythrobacter sp. SDW2]|uniref:OmpA family protein n=1 Tax=Erythrobacter sp. SDW2 TaxID=2907154 RepID=UPI001F2032F2|nr:OmpA family protein [Erythrobacter sp. SDW2]UIP07869.1 OmpA family protein [Erythrobacter sp. SDW2]